MRGHHGAISGGAEEHGEQPARSRKVIGGLSPPGFTLLRRAGGEQPSATGAAVFSRLAGKSVIRGLDCERAHVNLLLGEPLGQ